MNRGHVRSAAFGVDSCSGVVIVRYFHYDTIALVGFDQMEHVQVVTVAFIIERNRHLIVCILQESFIEDRVIYPFQYLTVCRREEKVTRKHPFLAVPINYLAYLESGSKLFGADCAVCDFFGVNRADCDVERRGDCVAGEVGGFEHKILPLRGSAIGHDYLAVCAGCESVNHKFGFVSGDNAAIFVNLEGCDCAAAAVCTGHHACSHKFVIGYNFFAKLKIIVKAAYIAHERCGFCQVVAIVFIPVFKIVCVQVRYHDHIVFDLDIVICSGHVAIENCGDGNIIMYVFVPVHEVFFVEVFDQDSIVHNFVGCYCIVVQLKIANNVVGKFFACDSVIKNAVGFNCADCNQRVRICAGQIAACRAGGTSCNAGRKMFLTDFACADIFNHCAFAECGVGVCAVKIAACRAPRNRLHAGCKFILADCAVLNCCFVNAIFHYHSCPFGRIGDECVH